MKATELINKFKEILLSTPNEVIEETIVEETVELADETVDVKDVEVKEEEVLETEVEETEEVIEDEATEVVEEEVIEEVIETELSNEDSPESPESLSEEIVEETVELAEETTEEAPVEEAPVEQAHEDKYASIEELAGLKAEIKALSELLNNLSPKKDVPRELSAEDIENEQVEAEGISVSPEADVVAQMNPIINNKRTAGPVSQKDIVWGKLFGNN